MGIPLTIGKKSENEKFAGAVDTYTIEAMMSDKKALQAGTSHFLGQNFSKAFDVKFQDKDNKEKFVYATSWGVSTRLIGALIMVHGDDKGLRLPPNIAPIKVVIVPIYKTEEDLNNIKEYIKPLMTALTENNHTNYFDNRENLSPGFKFNEWEMKGAPIRIEIGMRDYTNKVLTIARRDTNKKDTIDINKGLVYVINLLEDIQNSLYNEALKFKNENTFEVNDYKEFKQVISSGGFVRCGWDGNNETENKIKQETNATIRCIPLNQNKSNNLKCIYTNNNAKHEVVFAKSY